MNDPPTPQGGLKRNNKRERIMEEIEKPMYYGAKPETFEAARLLRKNMTVHEKLLWQRISNSQICGVRFRRQHPIDFFIADFYCHEARLVVEIDGEMHIFQQQYDDGRSAEMEKYFIKVIRFTNTEIENNIESVIQRIENETKIRMKSPPWGI
ncbi:MAG: endonuclease domain-containing protein [Bacteroidales bacterium]|jgi:very-short-patch-repair endonuclease|nr:endonuclease domain-containing protein [Bacteroidales bacterium]